MEERELDVLRAKVSALERRLQLIVAAWLLTVVGLLVLGLGARQAISQPEVVRARTVQVVDRSGKTRAVLGIDEQKDEVYLALLRSKGDSLARLSGSEKQVRLLLGPAKESSVGLVGGNAETAGLFAREKADAGLALFNPRSMVLIGISAGEDGPFLGMRKGHTTLFQAP